jgi:hypothetical protein
VRETQQFPQTKTIILWQLRCYIYLNITTLTNAERSDTVNDALAIAMTSSSNFKINLYTMGILIIKL